MVGALSASFPLLRELKVLLDAEPDEILILRQKIVNTFLTPRGNLEVQIEKGSFSC
jgi:hypothetical protein